MVIDQQYERFPLLGCQLQTGGDPLSEQCARFRVWPANSFTAVVQEQCKIEHKGIRESLKQFAIMNQLRIIGLCQRIKFVDAYQRVLVGGIPMQELVLHKAGELTKFGNVAAKKIDTVHHSQDATYSAFLGQNRFEDRTRPARVLICPGHVPQASAQKILQLRTNIHLVFLRQLKRAHYLLGIIAKNIATRRVQLFVFDKEKLTKRGLVGSC